MYGFGYGFGGHARRSVTVAGGGGGAPSASITLTRTWWGFGSSSEAGGYNADSTTGNIEDQWTNVCRAIEGLGAGSTAYTVVSGDPTARPIDYNLTGASSAYKLRNRGLRGATAGPAGTIVSTMTAAAGGFGAGDGLFLHQGDNGLTVGAANIPTLAAAFAAMRASAGARTIVEVTPTRTQGEAAGGHHNLMKNIIYRVESDLNPGKVYHLEQTVMERGTAADANDLADYANGQLPRSYMTSDGGHQNVKAYNLQSDVVRTPLIDAVEGGTPFPLRQIIESVQPAVPAAGDIVGQLVFYGSGGSFALDASSTQTDYAISSSGQITRIGATPPTRDVTWMAVKCSKTGRFDKVQPRIGICERAGSGVSKMVEFDGFSLVGMDNSQLANSAKMTILMRLQGTDLTADRAIMGASNQGSVTLKTNGALEILWRNSAAAFIFNKTTAANLFRSVDPPRWAAICMDLSNPAAEITKLVTWVDPATATSDTALHATLTADTTTAFLARLDQQLMLGNSVTSSLAATFKKGRIGDVTIWRDYIDFDVQARRAEVCDAAGVPLTAWVSGGGVTDGKTPNLRLAGNAGDFRQGRLTGSSAPATPGASGQYMGFSSKERSLGVQGYLVTV